MFGVLFIYLLEFIIYFFSLYPTQKLTRISTRIKVHTQPFPQMENKILQILNYVKSIRN
jgi:hypothetical protein